MCFPKDAKLGKKCTLLDLSRLPSVAEPEAQGAAVFSSEAKDRDSSSLSKSVTDLVEDLESSERMQEEKKEGVDEKEKSEELSADESPAKMEVEPTDLGSDEEQSMTECDLVSNSIVFKLVIKHIYFNIMCPRQAFST